MRRIRTDPKIEKLRAALVALREEKEELLDIIEILQLQAEEKENELSTQKNETQERSKDNGTEKA
jgi:hypothetical protein